MAKKRRTAARRTRHRRQGGAPATTGGTPTAGSPVPDLRPLAAAVHVIAQSFAVIALRLAPSRPKTVGDRARFLAGLGLSHEEIAGLLDSTPGSVGELLSRARRNQRSAR